MKPRLSEAVFGLHGSLGPVRGGSKNESNLGKGLPGVVDGPEL